MIENGMPGPGAGKITLLLLDPVKGNPVQAWEFDGQELIKIGRAPDNDIVIPEARVSRLHAELQYSGNQWELINHGRNGTLLSGRSIERVVVQHETCFRLGRDGPSFRFRGIHDAVDEFATMVDSRKGLLDLSIHIDEERKARDVQGIVESDYFRQLRQASKELKNRAAKKTGPEDTC